MKNEVIVERLDTLIKQNKTDHEAIIQHQKLTNGKVRSLVLWRAVIIGMGTVVTGAVIPLIIYISANMQCQVDEIKAEIKVVSSIDFLD